MLTNWRVRWFDAIRSGRLFLAFSSCGAKLVGVKTLAQDLREENERAHIAFVAISLRRHYPTGVPFDVAQKVCEALDRRNLALSVPETEKE